MHVQRLRQDLLQVFPLESAPARAHRREAVRVQLGGVRQALCQERRAVAAQEDAHGGEEVRVPDVREEVHEERSPDEAHEEAQGQQEGAQLAARGAADERPHEGGSPANATKPAPASDQLLQPQPDDEEPGEDRAEAGAGAARPDPNHAEARFRGAAAGAVRPSAPVRHLRNTAV